MQDRADKGLIVKPLTDGRFLVCAHDQYNWAAINHDLPFNCVELSSAQELIKYAKRNGFVFLYAYFKQSNEWRYLENL